MTNEENRTTVKDIVYLASCAVNGKIPDKERVEKMDLNSLYMVANRHLLTGITAMALESAGVTNDAFTQAKGKAIRKVAAFDVERAMILEKFEEAGIWYAPLKGSVLKDLYPKIGMRQMADNDILYDDARTPDVRMIMEGLGFVTDSAYGKGVHDHYMKEPVLNFEMHRALFGIGYELRFLDYYKDVKNRLVLTEGTAYGYHFTDEDFYIYIIAHEYKHYSGSGTGLRSLLDTYVYDKEKGRGLNRAYIEKELEKLELADFEAQNLGLARRLFQEEELTKEDLDMLDFVLSSGTYGNVENRVENSLNRYQGKRFGKLRYLFSRVFLPMNKVRAYFPTFAKYPILLPFLPLYRTVRGLILRRSRLKAELAAVMKFGKEK